ncbi:MAG: META domain-containing protein [Chloroflexota bacterium]
MKKTITPFLLAVLLVSCAYAGSGTGSGPGTGSGNGSGNGSGGNGTGSASPNPSNAGTPAGSWILTKGTTLTGEIPILDDHPITLVIDAEKAGGHAACNIYGGTVTVNGDAIRLAAMSMTEMACIDERAMNAEADYMTALTAVTRWAREGDRLVLSGEGVELTFALQPPIPDAEIVGTNWVLDTLMQGDAASTVQGATLLLAADGTFIASTGCRHLAGSYQITGDAIDFADVTATGDCSAELQQQHALVLDVLDGRVSATVDGSILTLTGNDQQGLGYHAAPAIE